MEPHPHTSLNPPAPWRDQNDTADIPADSPWRSYWQVQIENSLSWHIARPGLRHLRMFWRLPAINLIWLFWLIISPWIHPQLASRSSANALAVTYASLAVFLVVYLRFWFGPMQRAGWNLAMIALLGLALMPANGAAWSYMSYVAALLPFVFPPKPARRWIVLALAVWAIEAHYLGFTPLDLVISILPCIGLFVANLAWRVNARQEVELYRSHAEVRRLAALAERERIGRDLHDLLGHTLALISLKSELAGKLLERNAPQAREEVAQIQTIAREALAQVRAAVTGMRSTGLTAELAAARLLLESAGIELQVEAPNHPLLPSSVPADAEIALALCLRELVTNIERHAAARRVLIEFVQTPTVWKMRVNDDGRGGVKRASFGNGLSGICERLAPLNGSLEVASPMGGGTDVWLGIPCVAHIKEKEVDL